MSDLQISVGSMSSESVFQTSSRFLNFSGPRARRQSIDLSGEAPQTRIAIMVPPRIMNTSNYHSPYLPSHVLDDGRVALVNCLSFSPFGEYLASGREDGTIAIWDTQDGKYLHCIDVKSPVLCLAWDPVRRSRIFCGLQNGTVAFFDKFQVFSQ